MLSVRLTVVAFLAATGLWTAAGEYDVACPGVNSDLQCPDGQMIQVVSMKTGFQRFANCDDRSMPVPYATAICLDLRMLPWSKFICDNMQTCRLPKPNVQMFTCRYNTANNYIQYTYNCINKPPGARTVVACEGETAALQCETGVIKLVKAVYGRTSSVTCTDTPTNMTFCSSYKAQPYVAYMCNNKAECNIEATSETLGYGTNCDESPKYLEVQYVCDVTPEDVPM